MGLTREPNFFMRKISKATLQFLKDIQANNNREWFQENKARYETAQKEVKSFFAEVQNRLEATDMIAKMKIFRIYRDVRFSKDKSPYKSYFAGSYSRATKQLRGGYYFSIEPNGKSMIGGGFYNPNSADLKLIRQKIQRDAAPLRAILADEAFQKNFGTLRGEAVKTAPKGFSKDDPNIDLIRYKQFYVQRTFTDAQVTSANFMDEIEQTYLALRPYFDYMSEVLTSDLNGVPLYED